MAPNSFKANAQTPATLPPVTITGVAADEDSVKVRFNLVPGAADYRIYNAANPTDVKYAGMLHLRAPDQYSQWKLDSNGVPVFPYTSYSVWPNQGSPNVIVVPNLEIEWNGVVPKTPTNLVVEAVNEEGPIPKYNLYDANNNALYTDPAADPMDMLGSNMGATLDNLTSTNGQGDMLNVPVVIARSSPVTVTSTGNPTLPTSSSASQVVYDTFTSGSFSPLIVDDPSGNAHRTLTSDTSWDVVYHGVDYVDSNVFVMGHHFMDVTFDGGVKGSNVPLHVEHGSMAISPKQAADISGNQILHATMEVDGHVAARRWLAFNLAPANDPLTAWYPTVGSINNSNQAVFVEFTTKSCNTTEYTGTDPNNPGVPLATIATNFWPAAPAHNALMPVNSYIGQGTDQGLDNRMRFDLFASTTHYAVFVNGNEVANYDWPTPLSFSAVKVYFTHYVYHTSAGVDEMSVWQPDEDYWIKKFPYSDERHWDNMGYEVLPASTDWTNLAPLCQPAAFASPVIATGTGTGTGTNPVTPPVTPPTTPTIMITGTVYSIREAGTSKWLGVITTSTGTVSLYTKSASVFSTLAADLQTGASVMINYTPNTDPTQPGTIVSFM